MYFKVDIEQLISQAVKGTGSKVIFIGASLGLHPTNRLSFFCSKKNRDSNRAKDRSEGFLWDSNHTTVCMGR